MDNITKIIQRLERLQAERRLLTADIAKRRDSDDSEVIADLENMLRVCERSLSYTEKKIGHVLKRIREPKLHNILEAKIYMSLTWEEVAERIDCDVRTVYRLKKKAEAEFNRILALIDMTL